MRRTTLAAFVLVVLFALTAMPAEASFSIMVGKDYAHVRIEVGLYQELTEFPAKDLMLTVSDLETAKIAFNAAIKSTISSADARNLLMRVLREKSWMNVTVEFDVYGIAVREGDVQKIDCKWMAFTVEDDLRVQNISLNRVGFAYLRPEMQKWAEIRGSRFYQNKTLIMSPEMALNKAGNVTLLNFRPLARPIEKWTKTYDLGTHTTKWSLDIGMVYEMLTIARLPDNTTRNYNTYVGPMVAEVTAPGFAKASGNTIISDVSKGSAELAMIAIVIAIVAAGVIIRLAVRRKV